MFLNFFGNLGNLKDDNEPTTDFHINVNIGINQNHGKFVKG